jgi:hypothetical protein
VSKPIPRDGCRRPSWSSWFSSIHSPFRVRCRRMTLADGFLNCGPYHTGVSIKPALKPYLKT